MNFSQPTPDGGEGGGEGSEKIVHWCPNLLLVTLPLSPRLHGIPVHKIIIIMHLSSRLQTQWAPRRGSAEARRGCAEVTTAV
jgi:hypothetical protein